jgi:putative endonuclease
MSTTARGRHAEQRVAAFLAARGYVILGTNVRVGRDELDVVALDGRTLVIVEVRLRAADAAVDPFTSVTGPKVARLRRAVERYAASRDVDDVRIDVAAVVGDAIEIIENAIDFTST